MLLKVTNNIFAVAIHQAIQKRQYNWYKYHRSHVVVYLKSQFSETYIGIPQLLLCMPYLLRYGDIEFWQPFWKWPSPRYPQFLKCPPSRILKPYVYITQINSHTFSSTKCLLAYRAGPGLPGTIAQQMWVPLEIRQRSCNITFENDGN